MAPSVSTSSERLALANPTRPSFAPHQHAHPRRYSRWSRHVSKLQPTLYRSLLSRALLLQKYGQRVHRLALRIRFSDVRYPGHLARIKALYGDLVASGFSELSRNHRFHHDRRQSLDVGVSSRSSRSSPVSLVDLGYRACCGMPGCRRAVGPAESSPEEFPGVNSRCVWVGAGIRQDAPTVAACRLGLRPSHRGRGQGE